MSYYRICPNCGKGTTVRYEDDDSLCGECSDNSASIDKLSVEKLQEENNKLRNEIARLENQTQVDYRLAYEETQEQLNTAKKALTEAIEDIEQLNGSDDTIKYYKQALAAIGGDDED